MRPPIKNPTLLLITIVAVSFTACHKDQTQLAGKWQEVTVRSYSVNKSTGKTTDTTVANFGGLDYAIFSVIPAS